MYNNSLRDYKQDSVLGIRLAGHATRPEDLIRMRWKADEFIERVGKIG